MEHLNKPGLIQRLRAAFAPQQPAQHQSDRMPDLERWVMPHRSVDMQDWQVAYNMATNVLRPDRTRLMDLYDSILVDSHLASTMESRVLRVQRSRFRLVQGGEPKPDLLPLLQQQWFEDFLRYTAEAAFRGHTLIELGAMAKPGELLDVHRIDPRNVLPWSGMVVRRQGEETGYAFRQPPLSTYLIEVGRAEDLGLLASVAPVAIVKKYAVGSWSDYVHKYGIPPRWVKTNSRDVRRFKQLEAMMQNMLSSAYGVIEGDEEIQIMPTPGTDAHKVFDELISRMNSEISKRILGQDGTSDNKDASGTYGSLKVLQGVAEDRHQADKASAAYIINNELFPRLTNLGYPLQGVRFEWDALQDLGPMELVDAVSKLGMVFDIDPKHVEERTGIKILGARRMPGELGPGEWPPAGGGNPPGAGRQGGGNPPLPTEEDGGEEDEEDGVTASWPRNELGKCGICGESRMPDIHATAGLTPLSEEEADQVLREIEDSGGLFSQHYFSHTAGSLKSGLNKGWTGPRPVDPDAVDAVAHTVMEANIYQFAGMKTQYMAREMNEIARTSKGFNDFKRRVVQSKKFGKFENYRHTEYANAVNSGMQASRYYSMKDRVDALPLWRYDTMEDGRVRESHKLLNGKIFEHNDAIWNTIYPPNGWHCRCTVTPLERNTSNVAEPKDKRKAEEFIKAGEMDRMRSDGFAINRARLGEVFKLSVSYNKGRLDQAMGLKENYGRLWRKQKYSAISARPLPAMPNGALTRGDAENILFPLPGQGSAVFNDYAGRAWKLPRDSFDRHTDPNHKQFKREYRTGGRWKIAHTLPDILKEPDEVWLLGSSKQDTPGPARYKYIRYYQGRTIVVETEATLQARSEPSMRIITWYEAKGAKQVNGHRLGNLLKKNAR